MTLCCYKSSFQWSFLVDVGVVRRQVWNCGKYYVDSHIEKLHNVYWYSIMLMFPKFTSYILPHLIRHTPHPWHSRLRPKSHNPQPHLTLHSLTPQTHSLTLHFTAYFVPHPKCAQPPAPLHSTQPDPAPPQRHSTQALTIYRQNKQVQNMPICKVYHSDLHGVVCMYACVYIVWVCIPATRTKVLNQGCGVGFGRRSRKESYFFPFLD